MLLPILAKYFAAKMFFFINIFIFLVYRYRIKHEMNDNIVI